MIFDNKKIFSRLYGDDAKTLQVQQERYIKLFKKFKKHFGEPDVQLFSSPGRTEIGGNHTDHNQGKVLAASVDMDTIAAAARSNDRRIKIFSEGYPEVFSVNLDELEFREEEQGTSNALVRGMAARFQQLGHNIGGFNACIVSDVLPGSGLSSSAAVEILICTILNTLYNQGQVSPASLALIGQFAENHYFNKPCGLMDQLTCALGGIIAIDFLDPQKPVIKRVDFDFNREDFSILVVNSGSSHADLTEDYASIPREMKAVAECLGHGVCREIDDTDILQHIKRLRSRLGDRAVLRALHFLAENRRVDEQVRALEEKNFSLFLDLVQESGSSSCRWLQNCFTPGNVSEQGITLALALTEKYIKRVGKGACRVHGGGFAGTIQVFLPKPSLADYIKLMEAAFGKQCVLALNIRSFGACHLGPVQ